MRELRDKIWEALLSALPITLIVYVLAMTPLFDLNRTELITFSIFYTSLWTFDRARHICTVRRRTLRHPYQKWIITDFTWFVKGILEFF